jgi:enamine deaminase RidA (YjgF/YER057c/UK114 family)
MAKRYDNPSELFNSRQYGFSQLVTAGPSEELFFTSGQVAFDAAETVIGNTLEEQTQKALENLDTVIRSAGGTLGDVMSLRIYIIDTERNHLHVVGEALRKFFGTEHPPATTWIGVSFLAHDDLLIEIEAAGWMKK